MIDARPFEYWSDDMEEAGIRNITDSMDYSINRWKMVYEYLSNIKKTENTDEISFYFDIAKYHTNIEALSKEVNWEFTDNRRGVFCNGWKSYEEHESLNKPDDFMTEEYAELQNEDKKILVRLLEYC